MMILTICMQLLLMLDGGESVSKSINIQPLVGIIVCSFSCAHKFLVDLCGGLGMDKLHRDVHWLISQTGQ